ncbi:MAG: VTT domain-containing protein [bacterium]|nr:VTT domain-containing protein [bacterium]
MRKEEREVGEAGTLSWWRVVVLAVVLVGAMILVHVAHVGEYAQDIQRVKASVRGGGVVVWWVCMLGAAGLVAAGVPRLALCGVAGFLFGFVRGLLLMQLATLLAAYVTFVLVRWTGAHWAAQRLERYRIAAVLLHRHSPWSVFLVRQLPMHGVVLNVLLGASSVSHIDFLVGSFFGFLPYAVIATLVGSGVGKESAVLAWVQLGVAAVVGVVAVSWLMGLRRRLSQLGGDASREGAES